MYLSNCNYYPCMEDSFTDILHDLVTWIQAAQVCQTKTSLTRASSLQLQCRNLEEKQSSPWCRSLCPPSIWPLCWLWIKTHKKQKTPSVTTVIGEGHITALILLAPFSRAWLAWVFSLFANPRGRLSALSLDPVLTLHSQYEWLNHTHTNP